jgi:hypothetical protein
MIAVSIRSAVISQIPNMNKELRSACDLSHKHIVLNAATEEIRNVETAWKT